MDTKIINLFGGPGIGKSTCAATLFSLLKLADKDVELVTEFAKDLTWSERHNSLRCQPYVFGKQLHRIEILLGKVEFIVNDSPILLSRIYNNRYPESFNQSVVDIFQSMNNRNFLLSRGDRRYMLKGRTQTRNEAIEIDRKILNVLLDNKVPFTTILSDESAAQRIFEAAVDKV